jgi:hypothetical protein
MYCTTSWLLDNPYTSPNLPFSGMEWNGPRTGYLALEQMSMQ